MEIHFYPYDFEYKLRDGKAYVYLYGKQEDGTKICVIDEHRPFFYADVSSLDLEQLGKHLQDLTAEVDSKEAKVVGWEEVEKELLGRKKKLWKIYTNFPKAVPEISRQLDKWDIPTYEKDILFVHRYLRDKNITPMTLAKAIGEFVDDKLMRVPVFRAETIEQLSKESLKKVKMLAIDIETYAKDRTINPHKNPILMIAFSGIDDESNTFRKVITWKRFPHELKYLEQVNDEVDLIGRFREIVLSYNPDIITGYFSDGFDFPYLRTRADKFQIKLDLGVDRSEISTGKEANMRTGETKITGMLHLDMLKFIRNIFGKNLKTDSYSLDSVAQELLGLGKHEVDISELADVWDTQPQNLVDFCKYNMRDANLTLSLCQKLLYDMVELTKIIGLPTFDVIRMRFSRLVENYILKRAVEFNVLAPNKPGSYELNRRMEESIQGAFVYEPTPGLYTGMVVFDFRSLYPTIITAHNIGPEGLHCPCCKDVAKVPEREQYWFCTKDKTFIPQVLEELILRRVDLKRLIKEAKLKNEDTAILESRSYALKTLANSFYGYLGFSAARWYCLECAASTTAYARNYIKMTIEKAKEKGFSVCYADTDSCFLLLEDKNLEHAKEFMNEINLDLPGHMELEFEGFFPRAIFVAQKGAEKGAKKKYALLSEEGVVKITGFETVRRNWSPLAKEVQTEVLRLILNDNAEEALSYVKEIIKEVSAGKIRKEKLVLKTQITRELNSYESVGPHVAVARKMLAKGYPVVPGMVVEYIITKGLGITREKAKMPEDVKESEYDQGYYINNQIIPAVDSIFAVLGITEDQLLGKGSQKALGDFI